MPPLLQIENKAGNPVVAGRTRIIPFSQSVQLTFPGFPAGVVWNRPLSILAVSADGDEQVIRVQDTTRRIQVALIAGGILGGLLLWALSQSDRKGKFYE